MQRNPALFATLIVLMTIAAALFISPQLFDAKYHFRPWKLGLDLSGGSHLVYDIDLSGVESGDRESVVNGLRDVIEKRVNLFGVSEPQVFISKSGENHRLVVELAGIKDVSQAIKEIGETPFLNFAEVDATNPNDPKFNFTNLTGRYVAGAQLNFDQTTSRPSVNIS